ncbi:MAG: DMT family transporter [Pseudomonadota bacterium]
MNNESKGILLGLLAVTAFGLTLPTTHFVIPYLHPIFIGLGRAVVAALLAMIILLVSKQPLPTRQQLVPLCWIAFGVVIGFPVLSAWAMQSLPASHGGVVLGVLPIATVVFATLITSERPSVGFWVTGIIGAVLVVTYSLINGAGSFQAGDILLVFAILSAAVGYAAGGHLAKEMGGWQVICWALVIALPFILIPAWLTAPESLSELPISATLSFLYLALISQLLGFFAWYRGLALGGVARVSQTQLLQPFVTIFASALLLGEPLTGLTLGFAVLVVITVAVSKKMPIHNK